MYLTEDTKNALLTFYNEFIETGQVEFKANENINEYLMITTAKTLQNN